jgi:hypothetical protein
MQKTKAFQKSTEVMHPNTETSFLKRNPCRPKVYIATPIINSKRIRIYLPPKSCSIAILPNNIKNGFFDNLFLYSPLN